MRKTGSQILDILPTRISSAIIKEMELDFFNGIGIACFMSSTYPDARHMISRAFAWGPTRQGSAFWSKISNRYADRA